MARHLSGSNAPYVLDNLQAGQYLMVAFADAGGNGSVEEAGDFAGAYPSATAPELVSPPATGIDIQLVTNSELEGLGKGSLRAAGTPINKRLLEMQLNGVLNLR